MCGIAGIVGQVDRTIAVANVNAMLSVMARRGPDGEGLMRWDTAVFGHRRLAIFDLSDAGRQPMVSADQTIGLVFNGAIYNYKELREELISQGYAFKSQSDTEVLLHGFRQWGIDRLVARLRGMFAIAIWDNSAERLYLVRDRLGVKPLVYSVRRKTLAFASTVRALRVGGYAADLNGDAISSFLEFGFISDGLSIYDTIDKLPAGSIAEWCDGQLVVRRYWTPSFANTVSNISFDEAVTRTEELLLNAVNIRLNADVPVGALLSGGIDSSLICWAVQRLGGDIQAFTIATPNDSLDESAAAKATARQLGMKHCVVEMSDNDTPEIEDLVSAYAEPFGSTSALGMLRISRAISQLSPIKVLLTGDGGDDVFLGYARHRHYLLAAECAKRLPPMTLRLWTLAARVLPRSGPLRRATAFLDFVTHGLRGVISHSNKIHRKERGDMFGDRLRAFSAQTENMTKASGLTILCDFLEYEFNTRFVGEYLTKVDGATMHYGIEARSPFLDHQIWEFASAIPFGVRLYRGHHKALLRTLVEKNISRTIARRPKRGFGVPAQRWVVRRWRPWVEELLSTSILENEGWVGRGEFLKQFFVAVDESAVPIHLWHGIVLEAWLRYERRLSDMVASAAARSTPPADAHSTL